MPNISDKLKEFFGDPTIPGQAVEEVLMNAKEMGYGPGGALDNLKAITSTEFDAYLEEKGWHKGTYTETIDGVEYTVGNDKTFGIPNFPGNAFPILPTKADFFVVIPDRVTPINIAGDITFAIGDHSALPEYCVQMQSNAHGMLIAGFAKTWGFMCYISTSITISSMLIPQATTHGRYDLSHKTVFSASGVQIVTGTFNKTPTELNTGALVIRENPAMVATDAPRLTFSKLASLINGGSGGGSEPLVITFTGNGYGAYDADKTFGDICNAFKSGKTCLCKLIESGNEQYFDIVTVDITSNGAYTLYFVYPGQNVMSATGNSADEYPYLNFS